MCYCVHFKWQIQKDLIFKASLLCSNLLGYPYGYLKSVPIFAYFFINSHRSYISLSLFHKQNNKWVQFWNTFGTLCQCLETLQFFTFFDSCACSRDVWLSVYHRYSCQSQNRNRRRKLFCHCHTTVFYS